MSSKVTLLIVLWTFVLFLFGIMWSMISSFIVEINDLRNEIQVKSKSGFIITHCITDRSLLVKLDMRHLLRCSGLFVYTLLVGIENDE